jgi:hypothetical protein
MTKVIPKCGDCGEMKAREDFYVDRKRVDGLHTYCKACCKRRARGRYAADPEGHKRRHREWVERNPERVRMHKARSAYGLTEAEYRALAEVCVICGARDALGIDHSHQSGRVRGKLCDGCNKGLGFFKDNPSLLFRAAEYVLGLAKPEIFAATYEPAEPVTA